LVWLGLAALLFWAPAALAQPVAEAKRYEDLARQAYDAKDFARAAELFGKAYELVPNALTKYNEARAWAEAGQAAPEADAHAQAVALGTLDASYAEFSRERLLELERQVGAVVLTEPAGAEVSVAHAQARPAPVRIHLAPGRYEVRVETPAGAQHALSVEIAAGKSIQLALPTAAPDAPKPSPDAPPPPPPEPATTDSGNGQWIAGWVCLAGGGALGIVAAVLGVQTLGAVDDFEATGNTDAELRDDAVSLRTWTNVATVAAVVVGGSGVVLLLTAPDGESDEGDAVQAAVRMSAGPGAAGVVATLRW
jgi:hypothetical protein